MNRDRFYSGLWLAVSFWLGLNLSARGGDLSFDLCLDTSSLIGHAAGPFSLDFQFNDGNGGGDGNNTVRLSNFQFEAGSPTGISTLVGGALGSLSTGWTLTDSTFHNELFQEFDPGGMLSFHVEMTTAVDAGPQPDEFSFAVLDSTFSEVPTLGPGGALLVVDITSSSPAIQTFASDLAIPPMAGGDPISIGPPLINCVPDATSTLPLACLSGLSILAVYRGRCMQR